MLGYIFSHNFIVGTAVTCLYFFYLTTAQALPAFPGAEGYGAETVGGRGGKVVVVNSLADSGAGTLRNALEVENGRRTIIFHVGGTIELTSGPIEMEGENGSYVTVAGQTAPGDGIQLKNYGIKVRSGSHDIIFRHLRLRPGFNNPAGEDPDNVHGLQISGVAEIYNLVIDHCSIEWGIDENVGLTGNSHDITIQRSIIAEGSIEGHPDGPHSMGLLVAYGARNISLHHNYIAHTNERVPKFKGGTESSPFSIDFRNNVVYNWGANPASFESYSEVNFTGNHFIWGPDSKVSNPSVAWLGDTTRIYVDDNRGPNCFFGCANDEWDITFREDYSSEWPANQSQHRMLTSFSTPAVTTVPSSEVLGNVLSDVGVTKPSRDSVDERIVNDAQVCFELGPGEYDSCSGYIGCGPGSDGTACYAAEDWPFLANGVSPIDSDSDGMDDNWENTQGLNPADTNDGAFISAINQYSNLENYLNSLAGDRVPGLNDTYVVTATAGQHGAISPAGTIQITHGEILNVTLTADAGYWIDEVSGCNGALTGNIYSTENITAPCAISASFTAFSWPMFLPAIISRHSGNISH